MAVWGKDNPPPPLTISDSMTPYNISGHLRYYFDQTGELTPKQVIGTKTFEFNGGKDIRLPQRGGSIWLSLDLSNPHKKTKPLWLESKVMLTKKIILYTPTPEGGYKATKTKDYYNSFYNSRFPERLPVLKIEAPPGKSRVYIQQQNQSVNRILFYASTPEMFHYFDRLGSFAFSLAYGGILVIIILNLLNVIKNPNSIFLVHALFGFSFCSTGFFLGGWYRLLLPEITLNGEVLAWLINLNIIALIWSPIEYSILFCKNNIAKDKLKRLRRYNLIYSTITLVSCIALGEWYRFSNLPYLQIVTSLMITFVLPIRLIKNSSITRYNTLAWFFFAVGIFTFIFGATGVKQLSPFTGIPPLYAFVAMHVLLYLGTLNEEKRIRTLNSQRVQELNTKLKTRLKTLRNISAGIAHEINNPLAIVQGNLQMIKHKFAKDQNPKVQERFLKADSAIRRIGRITEKIRSFTPGREDGDTPLVPIALIVNNLYTTYRLELEENSIDFTLDLPDEEYKIRAIPLDIVDALSEILQNSIEALKNTNDKKIRLKVTVDSKYVNINISDNGEGISKMIESEIFDPFITSHKDKGHIGMGLAAAYSAVENYGGKIYMASNDEETSFITELPRVS